MARFSISNGNRRFELSQIRRGAGASGRLANAANDPEIGGKSADRPRSSTLPAAATWFGEQLAKSHAAQARSYLEKRGVSDALVREFGLGFAPGARRGLVEYLQARDVTIDMIVEAGLAIKPDDGGAPYDRFRDRIIFPIQDARGRVIAFGGRAMQSRCARQISELSGNAAFS